MRWTNLTIDAEEGTQLPGYRDPAVVRHFDAPEAFETRFYEVRAKSALNKVPERSRMPFRWTVNPYRGCSHACSYCSSPDTPVLMADGTHRPIGALEVGDRIIGTVRDGRYRRYVETEVEAHWWTVKPAFRTTLADGTKLITSGDHRFLSDRGWKYVQPSVRGQRPHLTTNNSLIGTGAFAASPDWDDDYRTGYLCGVIRGDGHLGTYTYDRAGRRAGQVHRFRLALADGEALARAEAFLAVAGVTTTAFAFAAGSDRRRAMQAIRTSRRDRVDEVRRIIAWPLAPSDSWRKGFLSGIFDAEGSCSRGILRIPNTDPQVLGWTEASLRHFGFDVVVEDRGAANGLRTVRLRGGLKERLRFLHLTDPAIRRKRSIAGTALTSDADLRVVSVEPVGTRKLVDITTGTGDFIANGVVSHNCFARPTHQYLDMDAGRDFEREIIVKVNAPEVLRVELTRPSWTREHVAMGTNTDPYQWCESKYRLMPGILEALRDTRTPCSVLTKSPLLLRDLALMKEIAQVTSITANLSIPTLEPKAWRATEPRTPHPRARLEAVKELNRNGIPTGVLVAPLMPGINDDPKQVEELLQAITDAGATGVGGIALHLRPGVREVFMDWLRSERPDLVERYEELYARGSYAPPSERRRLAGLLKRAELSVEDAPAMGAPPGPFRRDAGGELTQGERDGAGSARPTRSTPPIVGPDVVGPARWTQARSMADHPDLRGVGRGSATGEGVDDVSAALRDSPRFDPALRRGFDERDALVRRDAAPPLPEEVPAPLPLEVRANDGTQEGVEEACHKWRGEPLAPASRPPAPPRQERLF